MVSLYRYRLKSKEEKRKIRKNINFFILSVESNRSFLNDLFGKNSVSLIQRSYVGLYKYMGYSFNTYICCPFKIKDFDNKLRRILSDKQNFIQGVIIKGSFVNFWNYNGSNIDSSIINIIKYSFINIIFLYTIIFNIIVIFFILLGYIFNLLFMFLNHQVKLLSN
jgi:hypothetical protein